MNTTFDESKVRRGQPQNRGQFATKTTAAPSGGLTLAAPSIQGVAPDAVTQRQRELRDRGYVRAYAGRSTASDVHDTSNRSGWWDEQHQRAEIREQGAAQYEMMPDDYSPGGHRGQALSGKRRTYRKLYEGAGISVRMPSASAIKRFSKDNRYETFDIPVQAEGKGGVTISGSVRVTQTGPNTWSTQALGMPPEAAAKVGESVNAILEARRPSIALQEVERVHGSLKERRRSRAAATGIAAQEVHGSSFVREMGYNAEAGEMMVNLGGRHYAYQVEPEVYDTVRSAHSVGAMYNALVKGRDRVEINQCGTCGNWYNTGRGHACNGTRPATGRMKPHRERLRRLQLARLLRKEQQAEAVRERPQP